MKFQGFSWCQYYILGHAKHIIMHWTEDFIDYVCNLNYKTVQICSL